MKIDQDKHLDLLIDQALREFPLEEVPGRLKANIMKSVEKPLTETRYRISWVDLALSGTLAMVIGFALNFIQGAAHSPYWITRFRVGSIMFWQDVQYFLMHNQSSLTAILLSAGMICSLLFILAGVYRLYAVQPDRLPA